MVSTERLKLILSGVIARKYSLQILISEYLQLDTFEDKWAFVAVAMVQIKDFRPKSFPTFMGNNFLLIGYRIFVRYTINAGKSLRGFIYFKVIHKQRKYGGFWK